MNAIHTVWSESLETVWALCSYLYLANTTKNCWETLHAWDRYEYSDLWFWSVWILSIFWFFSWFESIFVLRRSLDCTNWKRCCIFKTISQVKIKVNKQNYFFLPLWCGRITNSKFPQKAPDNRQNNVVFLEHFYRKDLFTSDPIHETGTDYLKITDNKK